MNTNTFIPQFPFNHLANTMSLTTSYNFCIPIPNLSYELGNAHTSCFGNPLNQLEQHMPSTTCNNHFTERKETNIELPQEKLNGNVMKNMEPNHLKPVYTEQHLNEHTASVTP